MHYADYLLAILPDRSSVTVSVDITLILLSSAFVLTRLYVRKFFSDTLGLDDFSALISLVRYSKPKPMLRLIHPSRRFFSQQLLLSLLVRCPYIFRVFWADDRTEVRHGMGRHLVDVDRDDLRIFMQVRGAVRLHLITLPDSEKINRSYRHA